jgi:hypothetical protein
VPLSEEEQRILQEMEQNLREHDRDFADRVSHGNFRLHAPVGSKWAVAGFVAGFAVLLSTFRFSIALGALGFFVMMVSTLAFAHDARQGPSTPAKSEHPARRHTLADELSDVRRRIRSRFGHRD